MAEKMKKKKTSSIKTNLFFSFISQFIIYIAPFFVLPYVSRVLGADGVGSYNYAYSYVYYFSAAIVFGFSLFGIKAISANRKDKIAYSKFFWTIVAERSFLFAIGLGLYLIVLFAANAGPTINMSIKAALLLVLVGNVLDISFLFQGLEKFGTITVLNVLSNVLYVAFVFLLVKNESDLLIYTIIKSSFNFVLHLILWLLCRRYLTKPCFDFERARGIFAESARFFLPMVLMQIPAQIDHTIIGAFCSEAEVGYYAQAAKFPTMISSIIYSIAPVMLSRSSFLFADKNLEEAKDKIGKAINLSVFLSLPCCAGLFIIGKDFIPLFFGEEFVPSVKILYILIPASLMSPLSSILINSYYFPSGKSKNVSLTLGFAVIVNVLLTLLFTGLLGMGAIGAAIGSLAAEFILLLSLLFFARKVVLKSFLSKDFLKMVLSVFAMVFVCLSFNLFANQKPFINVIFDVFVGASLYFFVNLILREKMIKLLIQSLFRKSQTKQEDRQQL